ncbi:hypothetical protein [Nonomuraea typhae]|uniref:hypothetical protein n=1 Tax=Nonomuraea typhae TaxID=2603600 RepID=UPI0012F94215|nr:hypothetical protein [Nonomuraea typhae]
MTTSTTTGPTGEAQAIEALLAHLTDVDVAELLELARTFPGPRIADDAKRLTRELATLRRRLIKAVGSVIDRPSAVDDTGPADQGAGELPAHQPRPAATCTPRKPRSPRVPRKGQGQLEDSPLVSRAYPHTADEVAAVQRLCQTYARTPEEASDLIDMLGVAS